MFNPELTPRVASAHKGQKKSRPKMDRTIKRVLAVAAEKGLSNTALAEVLDISPQRLTNWIRRGMPARFDRIVANKLGVSIDVIHDIREITPEERRPVEIAAGNDAERRLLMYYRNTNGFAREALMLMAEALQMMAPSARRPHPMKSKARKKTEP